MADERVHDLDRLLGVVDRNVHVHPEDQLAPRDVLQLVDEGAVAVLGRDALPLEQRERMGAGGADAHSAPACDLAHVAAQAAQLCGDVRRCAADGSGDLEHRLHELGIDARLELVAGDGGEHGVDVLHEVEALAVEQHVLLLDAERVRVALSEGMVEHASAYGVATALAGDRRRNQLAHGSKASASISTRHAGSRSPATTTNDVAGFVPPKTSPCARPTSSQSAASIR